MRTQGRGYLRTILSILGVGVTGLLAAVISVRQVYNNQLAPVSNSQRAQLVDVPLGASAKEIAAYLEEAGVIRSAWAFEWYVRNNSMRDKLQAGTYYLRPNQGVVQIANILTQGGVASDLVTILPGQRIDQIRSAFIQSGYSEQQVDDALNTAQYRNHPALVDKPRNANLEGYLYPESFHRTATTSPEQIVRKSLDEMQKHLTPEIRAGFVKQGLTTHQGVILASIIEQEIGTPNKEKEMQDKSRVAQVFLKRRREGIPLQSDPTAVYGAIVDGVKLPTDPAQAASMAIAHPSAHNTYKHAGLTPGPISNVRKSSLDAVANPAQSDYLYFVAGDDGTTYFSRTLSEHEELTRKHCKKLCFISP
ncbi:endolytic transglycosylase MltG [soil metagenome]